MIHVVVDDLAFVEADAIVRPTTSRLEPVSSSLNRLDEMGGTAFRQQLHVGEELSVGAAVVTGGGGLAAELVIHAVISAPGDPPTRGGVARALQSVLERAGDWQVTHLALPPVGVGPGNLSVEESAQVIRDALRVIPDTAAHPRDVTIVVDREEDRDIFEAHLSLHPKDDTR